MDETKIISRKVIKNRNADGQPCKQSFDLLLNDGNCVLMIRRLTLYKNTELKGNECVVKVFKNLSLVYKSFGVKYETFAEVANWIIGLAKKEEA